MLQSLKNIFKQVDQSESNAQSNNELILLCGLMLEAANTDGKIEKIEIEKISDSLIKIFKEDTDSVKFAIEDTLAKLDESQSLHFYTSQFNKIYNEEKKILLIETLWGIVLSDGQIHDFESNLIRRLAGLLYISDVNCGNAKKRALKNLEET